MITSSLREPGVPDETRSKTVVDARIESKRLGPGRLDHTLTLDADVAGVPLWTKTITFAVDAPFEVPDLRNADPFVIAALFPAMSVGGTLRVHGAVSRVLMRNVLDYQSAWTLAGPHVCHPFAMEVAEIDDRPSPSDGPDSRAILAFSGGLDAMLALCRNVSGDAGPTGYNIGATMAIHGMLTGRDEGVDPGKMIADLRRISDRWDVPLAVVDTNIAEIVGRAYLSHGTWLSACLSLFGEAFDVGLLGSSVVTFAARREIFGSHPLLDRLLSGGQMEIRNDEGFYQRVEKAGLLARYPSALEDLRVCTLYYRNNRNCCRCEKCIRTMLCFIASGNPIPPAFSDGLRLEDIGIGMGRRETLEWAPKILAGAELNGVRDDPAIRILRRRYRVKAAKVTLKERLKRLVTGRSPHRWYIFDRI